MPQEFSAGVIAFLKEGKEVKYLLIKYTKGYWSFSHGQINEGESSRDAAYRELKEETGLEDLKPFEGFKTIIGLFYRKEGKIVHKDITFYLAQAKQEDKEKVKLAEHTEYCWAAFDEAIAKLQFKNDKEVLTKAKEFLMNYYSEK